MKKCPLCAETIQDDAIKCRFCGEFLNRRPGAPDKWYFKTSLLVLAFLCSGPLALPYLWVNPRYSRNKKITVTVIVLILTGLAIFVMVKSIQSLTHYYDMILDPFNSKIN